MDPVRAEAVRTLFVQIRNQAPAAVVVASYMIGTAWPFTPTPTILAWAVVIFVLQGARLALRFAFFRRPRADTALEPWARLYTLNMFLIGLAWGTSFFLFAHPERPITVALTLCCLYAIAAGSTPSHAYYPPSLDVLVAPTFLAVLVRLLETGEWGYILLGVASALYAVTMVGFCRVQARTLDDGFRIRFEHEALLEQLTAQKAEAEDARAAAERANLAKSQFLAAASHDLRQPLYALSLFSASLEELRLDGEGRAIVGSIHDSIAAMESLFDGLLDISKLEAGVVKPRPQAVSVDLLFDRLSQYFRPIAIERGLDLRFRSDGDWVTSDAALLEQVLSNLISNALRCTPRGGVLVAARARGSQVNLEVWDTGVGIDPSDLLRIFDDFVQLGNPERDRRKGLGLGLSIAGRAVALLGGTIEVVSRPGLGSRFSFRQPAAAFPTLLEDGTDQPPPREIPLAGIAPKCAVLIIDDDRDVRTALSQLLTQWGIHFDAVADGESALHKVADGSQYDLILADYRLSGGMNGLDLLTSIRNLHPAPPPRVALITADFDPALIGVARSHGVPLFHKPLMPAKLRELVLAHQQT